MGWDKGKEPIPILIPIFFFEPFEVTLRQRV